MNKIKRLSTLLLGLVAVSILLFIFDGSTSEQDFSKSIFTIQDTASISNIKITREAEVIEVTKENGQWALNKKYLADQNMVRIVKAVMSQVMVKRPIAKLDFEETKQDLLRTGRKVEIETDGDTFTYYVGGNARSNLAYFGTANLENIYIVEIPGYANYIAGIFELSFNQWRDRLLFNTHWRSLQSLVIDYQSTKAIDLEIRFADRFLIVDQIQKLDTARLMEYLQPFEYFQINDFLTDGDYPKYDSLLTTDPMAVLQLVDINESKSKTLSIFPKIPGEQFYLLTKKDGEMMVVDEKRMEGLLKRRSFFEQDNPKPQAP